MTAHAAGDSGRREREVPSSHLVRVGELRLHHLDWGPAPGPTVVFLHGGGLSATTFSPMIEHLRLDMRCLALDLRGHGDSDWSEKLQYRIEDFALDLRAWLTATGLRRVVLVGHSLGGLVSLAYVGRHHNDVVGLVLLDVVPHVDPDHSRALAETIGGLVQRLGLDDRRTFRSLDHLVALARDAAPDMDEGALRARLAARVRETPDGQVMWKHDPRRYRPGVHDGPTRLARLNALGPRVSCPTLIIHGSDSRVVSQSQVQNFAALLPDARVVTVAGADHMLHERAPVPVAEAVQDFAASL